MAASTPSGDDTTFFSAFSSAIHLAQRSDARGGSLRA
jgi:hypothetical protein